MNRVAILRTYVTKDKPGIEIAPWFNPLVTKRDGFNVRTLDYQNRDALIAAAKAANFGDMAARIEEVDFVGSAVDIADLVAASGGSGSYGYIISSHNFEHIPDPIRFLKGAAQVLEPGGHLSMAVPDKRCCFDFFRPTSTTADFLAAFFEKRQRPSYAQYFQQLSMGAGYIADGRWLYGRSLTDDAANFYPHRRVKEAYDIWQKAENGILGEYLDTHCWTFTPASLEIVLRDLQYLGVIDFGVVNVEKSLHHEIFLHLEKASMREDEGAFYARRTGLLRQMMAECATGIDPAWA